MKETVSAAECRGFYEEVAETKKSVDCNLRRSVYYSKHAEFEWMEIARNLGVEARHRVLDVGCGPAHLLDVPTILARIEYFGLDIATNAIAKEKRSDCAHFLLGNAESLPFEANSFDCVIASHLIEHLHDPEGFIAECNRVLKDRRRLVIVTPSDDSILKNRILLRLFFVLGAAISFGLSLASPRDFLRRLLDFSSTRRFGRETIRAHSQEEHVHEFKPEELCKILERNGFEILHRRFSGIHAFRYSLVLNDLFGKLFFIVSSKVESWQSDALGRVAYDMTYFAVKNTPADRIRPFVQSAIQD